MELKWPPILRSAFFIKVCLRGVAVYNSSVKADEITPYLAISAAARNIRLW